MRLALAAYHAGQGNVDRWRARGRRYRLPGDAAYVDEVERVRRVYAKAYRRRARGPIASSSSDEHELGARELVAAGTLQSEAVEHEVDERADLLRVDVVAELAVPLGLLDARTVRRSDLLLPLLDARAEGRVVAHAPEQLEIDREPRRVELHDLAHDRLEAVADPDLGHARVVAHRELDEEILLRREELKIAPRERPISRSSRTTVAPS